MIHSEDAFKKQVEEIINKFNADISRDDFELLYKATQEQETDASVDVDVLADKIINSLFKSSYGSEALIPWSFFTSPVGEVITAIKFKTERIILANEIAEITGYSMPYINKELNNGNLKGIKRGGTWIVSESQMNIYLKNKGKLSVRELMKQKAAGKGE